MKLKSSDAANVLKAFIQEDRAEARIYRGRVQEVSYILTLASFAMTAFLIAHMTPSQLRNITLLIDLGIVALMFVLFWRIHHDLVELRKALKARQNLLNSLGEEEQDIDPFLDPGKLQPDIKDTDLYWVVGLSAAVVLVKMSVVALNAADFVASRTLP